MEIFFDRASTSQELDRIFSIHPILFVRNTGLSSFLRSSFTFLTSAKADMSFMLERSFLQQSFMARTFVCLSATFASFVRLHRVSVANVQT